MPHILFIHPDLGIGGAERLVVDAALAAKKNDSTFEFLTNHYDSNHCFEETKSEDFRVRVVGDWLPRKILGKFAAFCAYFRMIYAAFYAVFVISKEKKIDIIFCDQISLAVPILKWCNNSPKILFYCHFPDQLLSASGSFLKQLYRAPLNYLEEKTTASADVIMVNSNFTRQIFHATFRSIKIEPEILYPSLNMVYFDNHADVTEEAYDHNSQDIVFLSLNRYERKKNLPLALRAFKNLESKVTKEQWTNSYLKIAGGYDLLNEENIDHYDELLALSDQMNLTDKITFYKSPSDKQKIKLIKQCTAVIYTPENEHFGIVPLEAMYLKKPVIACNSGGPCESVVHNSTGFLCKPNSNEFSHAMSYFYANPKLSTELGEQGRRRVESEFSFHNFTKKFNKIITNNI